jgi:F-type H+-transporting ATPase subunit epsilon
VPLTLSIVTPEHTVMERGDVARLIVPTTDGQITILPHHAALMASLAIGEMIVQLPEGREPLAIHGGFIQVINDEVSVLADAAEPAEAIDEARAEAARQRAAQRLEGRAAPVDQGTLDVLRAQLALQRALVRLKVKSHRASAGAPRA